MRKALIITIGLLAIIAAVFFIQYKTTAPIQIWDLVSSKTLAVVETDDAIGFLIKTRKTQIARLPLWADELTDKKIKGLIVIHRSSLAKLDTALVFPYNEEPARLFPSYKNPSRRSFNGYTINEFKNKKLAFAYSKIEGNLVVGSSLVVEDIIRTVRSETRSAFHEQHPALFQLSTLKSDDGNLYLNFSQLPISNGATKQLFAGTSMYDIKINENQVSLNGFVLDSVEQKTFLMLFRNQSPAPFKMKEVLPSQSLMIAHYAIRDFAAWQYNQSQYVKNVFPALTTEVQQLRASINWQAFVKKLDVEMALCTILLNDENTDVLVMKVNGNDVMPFFDKLLEVNYNEEYAGYQIQKFSVPFAEKNFWPITSVQPLNFVTVFNGYLLFGKTPDALKFFIDENADDNTVARSMQWSKFLSTSLQEATVSYFYSAEIAQSQADKLGLDGKFFSLGNLEQAAFQFNSLEKNFYSNAVLTFSDVSKSNGTTNGSSVLNFNSSVIGSLWGVVNHTNNSREVLLQDSSLSIHLTAKDKILWDYPLTQPITTQVSQIDFYNNNKLQYFFATKDQVHLIDRLGRAVKGFPKIFTKSDFSIATAIDYDGSKNFRYLLVNGDKILITDKNGTPLDGWKPFVASAKIIDAGHERVFGKDYFFLLTENGRFGLHGRNGAALPNFPIDIKEKSTGVFFIQGSNPETSLFVLLGKEGTLSKVNLIGATTFKEPLLKSVPDSEFRLIKDSKSAVIARIDKSRIAFFDTDGKLLFEKQNPVSEKINLAYFHSPKGVIAILDKAQNLLVLYDKSGMELLRQPLESTSLPVVEFLPKEKIRIHYANNSQLISRTL